MKTYIITIILVFATASVLNAQYEGGNGKGDASAQITSVHLSNWFETDGNWSLAGNWADGALPVSGQDANILADAVLDGNYDHTKLHIVSGGSVSIAPTKSLTISGTLTNEAGDAGLLVQSGAGGTGSLIVGGTASGNITFQRYLDVFTGAPKWHFVSTPVSGQAINTSFMTNNSIYTPNSGTNYEFFRWDEDQYYWIEFGSGGNPEAFTDTEFGAAKGYATSRASNGVLTFKGGIVTNTTTFPATYTADKGVGFNLAGNPFTSAIGITSTATTTENFLALNTALLNDSYEALYIWDEQTNYTNWRNDYKVISNAAIGGYTSINQHYIQPGQAFMVRVVSAGNLQFTTAMQEHATDNFYKSKEMWPFAELIVTGNQTVNSTSIGFNENMTAGLDPSYDVAKMKGNPDLALYSALLQGSDLDFAIQALPDNNIEDIEIPIGVDISTTAGYTFSIYQEQLDNYSILLEDRQEGIITDLRWNNYSSTISESGMGRFYLSFKNATGIEAPLNASKVNFTYANGIIHITNPGHEVGIIQITDICGRQLFSKRINGNTEEQIGVIVPKGIYIARFSNNSIKRSIKLFVD